MNILHKPVLLTEVIEHLAIQPTDMIVDGTIGYGGHSRECLKQLGPAGQLIGFDQDKVAIEHCKTCLTDPRVHLIQENFSSFGHYIDSKKIPKPTKLLLDLGFSSVQLDSTTRGFSFQHTAPLDMRMSEQITQTAADICNHYSHQELSDIFYNYGELRHNKKLCDSILQFRKKKQIQSTDDLLLLIKQSYFFKNSRRAFIQTVSKVFQALRIEVNDELTHLKKVLHDLPTHLDKDARVSIISFHSLEDRIVKHFFRDHKQIFSPINKKVITATQDEIENNSRAHSAKLRSYQKVI